MNGVEALYGLAPSAYFNTDERFTALGADPVALGTNKSPAIDMRRVASAAIAAGMTVPSTRIGIHSSLAGHAPCVPSQYASAEQASGAAAQSVPLEWNVETHAPCVGSSPVHDDEEVHVIAAPGTSASGHV